jgi:hypothetical protein
MRFQYNLHTSDIVEFTWLDLLKMALGLEIKEGSLVARRER